MYHRNHSRFPHQNRLQKPLECILHKKESIEDLHRIADHHKLPNIKDKKYCIENLYHIVVLNKLLHILGKLHYLMRCYSLMHYHFLPHITIHHLLIKY